MSHSFRRTTSAVVVLFAILFTLPAQAQRKSKEDQPLWAKTSLSAFKFRNVGPATTSGRIADLAVDTKTQEQCTWHWPLRASGKPRIMAPLSNLYSTAKAATAQVVSRLTLTTLM